MQYAPPELLRDFCQANSAVRDGAPCDVWAMGAVFEQLLAATCQLAPLFLPDPRPILGLQEAEKSAVVHSLVEAEHTSWVCDWILTWV